jgi:integrase/recombinase XerD
VASVSAEARARESGRLVLRVRLAYGKQKAFFALGESIAAGDWDEARKRVTGQGAALLNEKLRRLQADVEQAYRKVELAGESLSKERVLAAMDRKPKSRGRLDAQLVERFFGDHAISWKPATLYDYRTTFRDLDVSGLGGKGLSELNERALREFAGWLLEKGNVNKTVEKKITNVKSFLRWALKHGHLREDGFSEYFFSTEEVRNKPSLTLDELKLLEQAEWPHQPYLNFPFYRDILLFSCYTGLRYSDAMQLEQGHIFSAKNVGNYIDLSMIKGDAGVSVPLLPQAEAIIERNRGRWGAKLLPQVPIQQLNKSLKLVCKMAGITRPWVVTSYRGSKRTDRTVEKWEKVSSHTGRITFITLHEELGVPLTDIQRMVGHKKIETTARYTRGTLERRAEALRKAWNSG